MRNRVLRPIFPERERAALDSVVPPPSENVFRHFTALTNVEKAPESSERVANAFSELTGAQPQSSNRADTGQAANGQASQEVQKSQDLFGEVSRNLDKLRAVSEAQTAVLGANTQALAANTSAKSAAQTLSTVGQAAGGFLGALTALPLISGIFKLFGGGSGGAQQQPLTKYAAPSIDFNLAAPTGGGGAIGQEAGYDRFGNGRVPLADVSPVPSYSTILASAPASVADARNAPGKTPGPGNATSLSGAIANGSSGPVSQTHVTVNVSAMDSRSFLDRSQDIAQAVREAMLNMHSINDVVNDL